jgi:putative FmdB family regulatory protein
MPILREYRCLVCGMGEERREAWEDAGPPRCPYCQATAYHRVLFAPVVAVKGGQAGRLVGGERPFVRERIVRNGDGSETRYKSLEEARRGEYERAAAVTSSGLARTLLARKNARDLASGMLPGRESTRYRLACEEPRR